ncbi:MAG: hypothetical protein KDK71_09015, partial [Chlamydiia bacterium]|nr:hypothetical protein [Chlamydiia bacterium]
MSAQQIYTMHSEHIAPSSPKEHAEVARHYLATANLAEALQKINFVGENKFLNLTQKEEQERREKAEKFFTELLTILIGGGKTDTKEGATKGEPSKGGQKGISLIFDMMAVLLALEEMMVQSDVKKSDQSSSLGDANTKALAASYKKLKEEIYKQEHHHESFWDKIADFFKGIWDVITMHYSEAGDEFKSFLGVFKDLATLVYHAVKSLGEALLGGLADIFSGVSEGAKKFAHNMINHAKTDGEDILSNPAFAFVGVIISLVIIAAAVVSQQYELAAVAVVLLVLSQTGALNKLSGAIADGLEKAGMSKKAAKILADVLTVIIVLVASAGAGAAGSVETMADEAEQQAETEVQDLSSNVDETLTNEGTETPTDETQETNGKTKTKMNWKRVRGSALAGGSFGLGSVNLAGDIVNATTLSKKEKNKLLIALEVIQQVIAAIGGLAGGATVMSTSSENSVLGRGIRKIISKLANTLENDQAALFGKIQKLFLVGNIASGIAAAGEGGEKILQGEVLKIIGEIKATISNLDNSSKLDEEQVK